MLRRQSVSHEPSHDLQIALQDYDELPRRISAGSASMRVIGCSVLNGESATARKHADQPAELVESR